MSPVRPCVACGEPRADADCGPADPVCAEVWETRCAFGDHRRCQRFGYGCEVAQRWHDAVRAAGLAALARTGRAYATVCVACADEDGPRLVATTSDLWSGKGSRNAHARRHGLNTNDRKGTIYVVNAKGDFL